MPSAEDKTSETTSMTLEVQLAPVENKPDMVLGPDAKSNLTWVEHVDLDVPHQQEDSRQLESKIDTIQHEVPRGICSPASSHTGPSEAPPSISYVHDDENTIQESEEGLFANDVFNSLLEVTPLKCNGPQEAAADPTLRRRLDYDGSK
jgi:hypothetical protein